MSFSHKKKDMQMLLGIYGQVFKKLADVLSRKSLREELRSKPIQGNYNVRKV